LAKGLLGFKNLTWKILGFENLNLRIRDFVLKTNMEDFGF